MLSSSDVSGFCIFLVSKFTSHTSARWMGLSFFRNVVDTPMKNGVGTINRFSVVGMQVGSRGMTGNRYWSG